MNSFVSRYLVIATRSINHYFLMPVRLKCYCQAGAAAHRTWNAISTTWRSAAHRWASCLRTSGATPGGSPNLDKPNSCMTSAWTTKIRLAVSRCTRKRGCSRSRGGYAARRSPSYTRAHAIVPLEPLARGEQWCRSSGSSPRVFLCWVCVGVQRASVFPRLVVPLTGTEL